MYRKRPITRIAAHLLSIVILKDHLHLALGFGLSDGWKGNLETPRVRAQRRLSGKALPGNTIVKGVKKLYLVDRAYRAVSGPRNSHVLMG